MSTELKHTKGHWRVVNHNWSDTSIYSEDKAICLISYVGELDENDEVPSEKLDELDANAKLIAAAPELFAALIEAKEYIDLLEGLVLEADDNLSVDLDKSIVDKIESAIEKATS